VLLARLEQLESLDFPVHLDNLGDPEVKDESVYAADQDGRDQPDLLANQVTTTTLSHFSYWLRVTTARRCDDFACFVFQAGRRTRRLNLGLVFNVYFLSYSTFRCTDVCLV